MRTRKKQYASGIQDRSRKSDLGPSIGVSDTLGVLNLEMDAELQVSWYRSEEIQFLDLIVLGVQVF